MPMCGIRRAATSERRIAPTFPRGNGPGLRLCSGRNSKRTHRIHRHRWLPSVELRGFGNFKYVWLGIIRQEAWSGSRVLKEKLLKAIEDFTEGTPQTDDITFVVIERYQ